MRQPLTAMVFVLGLAAFAMPRAAMAQENLLVHVPFPFAVEGRVLPAGEYRVTRSDMPEHVLQLVSGDGRRSAFIQYSSVVDGCPSDGAPTLQFRKVNGHLELWRVAGPGCLTYEVAEGGTRAAARR